MNLDHSILTIILLTPLAGALLLALLPDRGRIVQWFALAITSLTFLFTLHLPFHYYQHLGAYAPLNATTGRPLFFYAFEQNLQWIASPNIHYHVGVDGLSLWLIVLTGLLAPLGVLASWRAITHRASTFYVLLLLQQVAILGVFISLDLFLYYGFWELSLVPMTLLIATFGRTVNRRRAAIKFFLYVFVPSAILLVAMLWLYARTGTFDMPTLQALAAAHAISPNATALWLASLAFLVAFAVKVPIFPLHGWLSDAVSEAPTAAVIVLAGKLGLYSILRFSLSIFPEQSRRIAPLLIALAAIGIVYGALLALVQKDLKRLAAFATLSALSFIVLGIFTFTVSGLDGGIFHILSESLTGTALFILLGLLYERYGTYELHDFGGLAARLPWMVTLFVIMTLSAIGLPMLNGFVGEFLILNGSMQSMLPHHVLWTALATTGVILSAAYMLTTVQRVFYGSIGHKITDSTTWDLTLREHLALWPLTILFFILGIASPIWMRAIDPASTAMADRPARFEASPIEHIEAESYVTLDKLDAKCADHSGRCPVRCDDEGGQAVMNPSLLSIIPEIILTLAGILIMLSEPLFPAHASRRPLGWLAIVASAASGVAAWSQLHLAPIVAYSGTIRVDVLSVFFHLLIACVVLITLLISLDYFPIGAPHVGEYFALILFGAVGMMLMTSASELLLVFVGLEISSISTYILAGFRRGQAAASEASLKYFLLGSFATAFFLYGIALIFGATGTTNIPALSAGIAATQSPLLALLALAMILVGLGFKVSAAPFHVWTPDVYQGAPAPVVGLMSTAPKAAAFAVLLRLLYTGFPQMQHRWSVLLWTLAVASMFIGNLGALRQRDVKRMLAYSSIAHAGYLLVAYTAFWQDGIASVCFYTAAYAAMNVGAFAVITQLFSSPNGRQSGPEEPLRTIDDLTGLAIQRPILSALFALFLCSLIGIPFTGGFFGKFYVFSAAVHAGHIWLAVLGLLNSGIACFYYLRLLSALYSHPADAPVQSSRSLSLAASIGLAATAIATLALGIFPGPILSLAQRAASSYTSPIAGTASQPPSAVAMQSTQ